MESLQAFMILALFLGIGEIVAVKTKAYIGSTFIMMALLLIAFWCGLDPEIVTKSQAVALGTICIGLLMVNLATSISLKEFLKQWKTIIIGLGARGFHRPVLRRDRFAAHGQADGILRNAYRSRGHQRLSDHLRAAAGSRAETRNWSSPC